eukprot:2632698-Amphidinium_carterae.1
MVDPFAGLAPMGCLFPTSNVSTNLGAATNDTNQTREQRVGQTSDLGTQDAIHVLVTGSEQSSVTVGYESKPASCPAIPEITPGLVRRGIEHISNLVRRSNSSPAGTPRTSPRSPVPGRQGTADPSIADMYACDWTSQFVTRVDFPSQAEGASQQTAQVQEVQQSYLEYVAQGDELQRVGFPELNLVARFSCVALRETPQVVLHKKAQ